MVDNALKNKLNQLSPQQLKELMKKLGKERQELPLMPRNTAQEYPASSAQKRMWFLSKMDEDSYLYTNPVGIRLRTRQKIDIDLYVDGFKRIVERHEIMRTSFFSREGEVFQRIHSELPVAIDKIDLRELDEAERENRVNQILSTDGQTCIRVEDFPLFRFKLLLLSELEFVFIYTSHHIISDAWSTSFIFRQMLEIYEQKIQDKSWDPPPLKYQFVDYVLWEKNWFASPEFKKTEETWKLLLPENPEPMRLPTDFARPPLINHEGALEKSVLDLPLVSRLEEFSKKQGANLFHTLLAVFNILLHKYTRGEEVVVGLPLANRKIKEFQQVVGMFLNTLPLQSAINPEATFADYLQEVKSASLKVVEHQDYPFDKLIERLNPTRQLDISPVFQVLFVFQNIPSMYQWKDMEVSPVKPDYHISKFDLNLWVEEVGGALLLSMTYQTSLFRRETIRQFLQYYESLLEETVSFPERKIADLQLVQNPPSLAPAPLSGTYVQEFEKWARERPDAPALFFDDREFSYAELNKRANRLAHYLLKNKAAEGKIVAFALDRSPEQIIAMLGTHKAGAAYLPLDPSLPTERLRFMLEDAQVIFLITEEKYRPLFEGGALHICCIDSEFQTVSPAAEETNPETTLRAEDLAYVLYTSGTTGMPKGVCISHGNVLNYAQSVWKRIKLGASTRFATVTSVTTDLGNTQIFPALTFGAAVDLIPDSFIKDPALLAAHFEENVVDCLKIVPSHLESLLNATDSGQVLPAKLLILGGEKIRPALVRTIRNYRPALRILNHYGPTETTIGILTFEIEELGKDASIPLGKALDNNCVWVADAQHRPLPDGYPGELIVCGQNVGRGYLNQEELTRRAFFQQEGNPMLNCYKTGDLVRRRFDGNIEFLGRIDRQVKIRGYRVELEGVEKILLNDPAIAQAVVLEQSGEIAAFYCLSPGLQVNVGKLKQAMAAALPAYMIPAHLVEIQEIPRLANGKINYQVLKNRTLEKAEVEVEQKIHPRDGAELLLAQAWEEVLKRRLDDIHANFFEIGGNSLKAIELIARTNARFGTRLGIGILFEHNTIASLAALLKKKSGRNLPQPLLRLKKGKSDTYFFLVHPAGGDVLSYYELARSLDDSVHVYGLQTSPADPDDASIQDLAKRYLELVGKQFPSGNFIFGGWSMGALVAFEMATQLQESHGVTAPVILLDQKAPSDEQPPGEVGALDRIAVFAEKIDHLVGRKTGLSKASLEGLTPAEQSAMFLQAFKTHNLVPEDLTLENFHGFLEKMIRHNEITMEYRPKPYGGNVLLLKAQDSTFIGDEAEKQSCYGWSRYASGDFSIQEVAGNHITLIRAPYVGAVADALNAYIQTVFSHPVPDFTGAKN